MLWLQLLVAAPAALIAFGYRVFAHEAPHHDEPASQLADWFTEH